MARPATRPRPPRRRPRAPGYTTRAGLGWAHQKARDAALKALVPGTPCPFEWICGGLPMYPTVAAAARAGMHPRLRPLDLDDFPGRVFGGPQTERLAHRYCNRRAGQRVGVKLRALRNPKRTVYDRW